MNYKFVVSSSPHIHQKDSISSIMLDVIIALIPAAICGIYSFGYRAATVLLTSMAACVLAEYAYRKLMKKTSTVADCSALLTGLLLGLNLPPSIPLWMAATGGFFAIIVVKQLYGGLGKNFINPALAARCFMLISWPQAMTMFTEPNSADAAISSATPLAVLKGTGSGVLPSVSQSFFGHTAGCIGEVSAAMLLIGFVYLLIRKVISPKIPLTYVLSFAILTFLFGNNQSGEGQLTFTLLHVLNGGLLLGAIFMATDYVTTPTTAAGQYIFALGCGILTFVIRRFGGYPEGTSFAIILMNLTVPLIDGAILPKKFGEVTKHAE